MANRYSRIFHHISINDIKKNREIMIERKRVQENKEIEERNYIDERMENKKSNWRESFTNVTVGMKVGQTFVHNASGETITTAGALGGVETIPSNVPIFGDEIPGPDASQYGLQGYAKPLNFIRRKDPEDTNKKLDASQEFAKKVNADVMMNARVKTDEEKYTDDWYKNRQKTGYYREKLGPIHGAMTDIDELKMNERLVQENEREYEIYKKNEATRVKHQKVIDKKTQPHLDQINSGRDNKIDLKTLYRNGAVVNDDGTRGLMIRRETTSAMGLSLTKTVITSYRGKNISTVGSVANREKLGITGQGKMTKVAEIKDPRLIEYKMPEELEMWQSQAIDPRGAISRSAGAKLAKIGNVESAFNLVNYFIDNHVLTYAQYDPTKENIRHNVTNLYSNNTKDILRKGMDELKPKIDAAIEEYEKNKLKVGEKQARGILNDKVIATESNKGGGLVNSYFIHGGGGESSKDIFNSLGNNLGFNLDTYMKTGIYQFDSTYKFTSTLDMGIRGRLAFLSGASQKYVSGQLYGETMMAVQNPMQFQVDIESGKQYSSEPSKTEPVSKQPTTKEPSKAVKKIKSMAKTKRQSLSLDEPIVRRKKEELTSL